jgi:hypothetical protein
MLPVSVSDLIKAVDTVVRFCVSVKNAPKELQGLLTRLESSSGILKELERLSTGLAKSTDFNVGLLTAACDEYQATLKDLTSFLEKYKDGHGVRDRTWFALWSLYSGQEFRDRITSHEIRIALVLQMYISPYSPHWCRSPGVPAPEEEVPVSPARESRISSPLELAPLFTDPFVDYPAPPPGSYIGPLSPVPKTERRSRGSKNSGRGSMDSTLSAESSIFSSSSGSFLSDTSRRESHPQSLIADDTVLFTGKVKLYAKILDPLIVWRLTVAF